MSTDNQAYMEIAKMAAGESGNYLRKTFGSMIKLEGELDRDVKLEVDYHSESIITNILSQESDFSILSEEGGKVVISEYKDSSEFLWIVDPLDGSVNYLLGIPLCCVSIGLWKNGKALLGVIYDFNRDEFFSGIVNHGAWLNEIPIFTSEVFKKSHAVLTTGFPVNRDFSTDALENFISNIKNHRKIRLLGSAALSLAYVACGRADAYMEENIMFWDVAAGCALVQSAGGSVYMKRGDEVDLPLTVIGTNGYLKLNSYK